MQDEISKMMIVDEVFSEFLETTISKLHDCNNYHEKNKNECADEFVPKNFECLRSLINVYERECGTISEYGRNFIKYLVRECE